MTIPAVPAVPNPLSTTFAADALAFTQWMAAAAPEFDAAADAANASVEDAQDARDAALAAKEWAEDAALVAGDLAAAQVVLAANQVTLAAAEKTAAQTARTWAQTAQSLAEDAQHLSEAARDLAQTYASAAGEAVGLPPDLSTVPGGFVRVNGAGNALEATNDIPAPVVARVLKTSAYTLLATDQGALVDCVGAWTLGADAGIAVGWWAYIRNTGNGDITIDPAGATTIGAATYALKPGHAVLLVRDASGFNVVPLHRRTYDRMEIITSNTSWVVPAGMYVLRAYAVGKGGDGAASASGGGAGMAFGDIAVTPGDTASIAFSSGVATVTVGGVTLLTANPASGSTAGTASTHVSVANGGAYSGGTGAAATLSGGASSGSPLGAGVSAAGGAPGGSGWGGVGSYQGGGVAAAGSSGASGSGFRLEDQITEPLLAKLLSPSVFSSGSSTPGLRGGPGAGGTAGGSSGAIDGGVGGFGGGGGAAQASGRTGGAGGFGGGGGAGAATGPGPGGAGGYGGGGGSAGAAGGAGGVGGAAAVLLLY